MDCSVLKVSEYKLLISISKHQLNGNTYCLLGTLNRAATLEERILENPSLKGRKKRISTCGSEKQEKNVCEYGLSVNITCMMMQSPCQEIPKLISDP